MSSSKPLQRFQVVLVGPKVPENVGAMARLLENFNVGTAALVSPQCEWKKGVAQWMATGPSIERLNNLPVFDELSEAVKEAHFVVGFTARSGRARKISVKLEDIGKLKGKVALVFGREDFCLFKEEVNVCTHLCTLDSNPKFPALNLSHSVAVVLSSLFNQESSSRRGHHKLATVEQMEPMFEHLRETMTHVGLVKAGNPDRMLARFRKIFQRAALTPQDIPLVRGFLNKVLKHRH